MNTASGQKQSNEYNEVIRAATLKWAILEQMKNPSAGFEELIRMHFVLKKESLMKQCAEWIKDAQVSRTAGFGKKIQGLVDEIKIELAKLEEKKEEAK
jgi:baculoviral IAP repeat-containing protein 6